MVGACSYFLERMLGQKLAICDALQNLQVSDATRSEELRGIGLLDSTPQLVVFQDRLVWRVLAARLNTECPRPIKLFEAPSDIFKKCSTGDNIGATVIL